MKLIVIFGPSAVGKMTVGHELGKLTGFKLFHNHVTLDLVSQYFDWCDQKFKRLVAEFRTRIMEEVATSNLRGLIFTYVWALNMAEDKIEIDKYASIFEKSGGEVYFVELFSDQKNRIERNRTEFRMKMKSTKRDVIRTEQLLIEDDEKYVLNTNGDFFYPDRHIKIDNSNLSPIEAAGIIAKRFSL
jgi:AAA domain